MNPKSPEAADQKVGSNIRHLRKQFGLSQGALAEKIGVTFQQVQKYEKGMNRVGSSRLVQIASVFGVKVETLFSGITEVSEANMLPGISRDAVGLANDFDAIEDPNVRLTIRGLVKSLSKQLNAHAA